MLNVKRLEKLANFLDDLPRNKFNIETWYITPPKKYEKNYIKVQGFRLYESKRASCDTVACALGWAAMIPSFHKAGLKSFTETYTDYTVIAYKPKNKRCQGVNNKAAMKFFGLSKDQCYNLFYVSGYNKKEIYRKVTPKMVSKKIREIIKEHQDNK